MKTGKRYAAGLFALAAAWGAAAPLAAKAAEKPAPAVAGSAPGSAAQATLALPPDWYPESVALGPDGALYVGSWRHGAVARLRPDGTPPQILVTPGSNGLANAQGVLVDAPGQLLWVCSGNIGYTTVPSTPSALKSYRLDNGAPVASYAMPDQGYCNDLAQDSRGTLYVSDSAHPRVLRLRAGEPALSVWKEDPLLAGGEDGYFLNGIALDGDDTLYLSAVSALPWLARIEVGAERRAGPVTRIALPRALKNADAIRSIGAGRLLIFESNAFGKTGPYGGQISVARVDGATATLATLVGGLNDPSSGVLAGRRVYFIESKYGLLFSHKDSPDTLPLGVPFDLQSVALPDAPR